MLQDQETAYEQRILLQEEEEAWSKCNLEGLRKPQSN